jgi:hypothetical protein
VSHYFKSVAIAAAAICTGPNADAAVITYTDSGRGATFLSQFNPLLGTLQSAVFTNTYSVSSGYRYTGVPGGPAPIVQIMGTVGNSLVGQATVNESVQSSMSFPNEIYVSFSKTVTTTFTSDLSAYIGMGRLFASDNSLSVSGYSPSPTSSGGVFSNVRVTYTYLANVAAVPEPATWMMMLLGFGMVAGAVRYRRRGATITCA